MQSFRKEPEIIKTGKINNVVNRGMQLMVQVIKEPIQTKGAQVRLRNFSLPGRFLVLTLFNDMVGVSRKIESADERKRLQKIIKHPAENYGVIVRTVAEGQSVQTLHNDLMDQVKKWEEITKKAEGAVPPQVLFSETTKTNTLLRDILNDSFNSIVVNDQSMANDVKIISKE